MGSNAPPIKGVEFYGQWKASKKPHWLPRHKNNGLEIVLVTKGELKWVVEKKEVNLWSDTLFYTLPWQEHGGVEDMQPSCEISFLCLTLGEHHARPQRRFRFHPFLGFTPAEESIISRALTDYQAQAIPASEEIAGLFSQFFRIAGQSGPLRQTLARDTIKLIVASLAEAVSTSRASTPRLDESERRVREFISVLVMRHEEPWTLDSMSAACRLHRTHFSQLLKKHTGDTPMTFLSRIRSREAQRLLSQSNMSITEIAIAVGFNSSQYFATVFKAFTGLEPRAFRAQARG